MTNNNIFELDKSKKITAFHPPRIVLSVFLTCFFLVFIFGGIVGLYDFAVVHNMDWEYVEGFVVPLVLILAGIAATAASVVYLGKQLRKKKYQTEVIRCGKAVTAYIVDYKCVKKSSSNLKSTTYEVTFNYAYLNLENEARIKLFEAKLNFNPHLQLNSEIMVAVNGEDTVILKKYSLLHQSSMN